MFLILLLWIIGPLICGIIAYKKNRNVIRWTVGGFFGSWIALLILIFLPKVHKANGYKKRKKAPKPKPTGKKSISGIIVGVSYIAVALVEITRILGSNELIIIVPYLLWVLLGIGILYRKKSALVLSLLSYPLIFIIDKTVSVSPWVNAIVPVFYTPFHHISIIIFQELHLLSVVKSYWIVYLWGVYVLHFICLFPSLFKKREKARKPKPTKKRKKVRKPEPTFVFPEEALIYEKNAFRVLGLEPQKATMGSIAKRKNALSVLIKATLQPKEYIREDYHAISWLGVNPITEADIINAYSRLQDNLKRIREELFWFYLEGDNDEAFRCLVEGDFERGRELWEAKKGNNPQTYSAAQALHNLAVLEHILVLNQEKSFQEKAAIFDQRMSNRQIDNWKRVFNLWVEVYENDECWDYFKQRMVYLNDPRIKDGYIHRLRRKLPGLILKVNLEIVQAALAQEMFNYARQHLDLIKDSGFRADDTNATLEEFFSKDKKELEKIRESIETSPDKEHRGVVEKVNRIKNIVERVGGKEFIEKEMAKIKPLLDSKTCYFCGIRTADPKYTLEVKMYKEINRIPMIGYTNVEYQTITIKILRCKHKHKSYGSHDHPTVKQSLDEGWNFGEKPPDLY